MLEVELKFPVQSVDEVVGGLRELGAAAQGSLEHVDSYFAHPIRDFAQTDEALRIRRIGERNLVTYKGPKMDATTKTRREIEFPLADGPKVADHLTEMLDALGFRPVAEVRKTRTAYTLEWESRPVEVALDSVKRLGTFVEIETAAADESELDAARAAVTSLAAKLGLHDAERRSYLELLL